MKLRVALAQINPTVGDLAGNSALIRANLKEGKKAGAHVVVFPEMILTGYPVEDLATRPSFQRASIDAVAQLAKDIESDGCGDVVGVVGYLDRNNGAPQNAVALIHGGQIKARYAKRHLPNYGVFDEYRNFVSGDGTLVARVHGVDIGFAICEDIWQEAGMLADLAKRTPGLVLVPNGSPFERKKDGVRLSLVQKRAKEVGAPFAYVNMTGGQDDLVFDGDTIVVDAQGKLLARAAQFDDQLLVLDIEAKGATSKPDVTISEDEAVIASPIAGLIAPEISEVEQIWKALVLGLRDYIEKNGFRSVVLGLSGGIDSALVAAIAVDALGAKRVNGVAMPSKYSSEHSIEDAQEFAKNTGIHFRTVAISPMVDSYMHNLANSKKS